MCVKPFTSDRRCIWLIGFNPHLFFQEGRTCDWESFEGRDELRREFGYQVEPWKTRATIEKKQEIRRKYRVPLPTHEMLFGPILKVMIRDFPSLARDHSGGEE